MNRVAGRDASGLVSGSQSLEEPGACGCLEKTLIVTGASSGIGAAAAELFAAQGAKLVLGARREALLQAMVERIVAAGGEAAQLAGDVRDEAYASALTALAEDRFGGLDGAFNNAGVLGDQGTLERLSLENWRETLDSNLTSAFLAARAQIPALIRRGGGALVFTASFVGANAGMPGMSAYAASKAGLLGLARSLAVEQGPNRIRVNALSPGGTRTPMAGEDPAFLEFAAGLHALKRLASPEEIAAVAAFLLSDQASFVTGAAWSADGGAAICKT